MDKNYATIEKLIAQTQQGYNLVVLPFNSLIGDEPVTKETAAKLAEPLNGKSYALAAGLAKKFNTYLLFSMPEVADGTYYETAVLFDYDGNQVGIYRKSHLNDAEQTWATAGDDLPVFNTNLGRIAVVLNDEQGHPLLPSIVRYLPDGAVHVGYEAQAEQARDPRNTVVSVPTSMDSTKQFSRNSAPRDLASVA